MLGSSRTLRTLLRRKKVNRERQHKSSLRVEELEPRILFSADGVAGSMVSSQLTETSVLLEQSQLPLAQSFGLTSERLPALTQDNARAQPAILQGIDRDAIERYALASLNDHTSAANDTTAQPVKQSARATFTVNTTDDTPDATPGDGTAQDSNGNVSLRSAIMHANELGGAHTIVVPAGNYALVLADGGANEDLAAIGDLDIQANITLQGAGVGQTIITASAGFDDRIFDARSGSIAISGVTISKGAADVGGGIRVSGSASVELSQTLLQNHSANEGGAIHSTGTLSIIDSQISDNATSTAGGGIHAGGNTTLQRVVLNSNGSSGDGGGIYRGTAASGSLSMTNVTVSGNTASASGGGIWSGAATSISNTTFTQNSASNGGGLFQEGTGAVNVFNTLIAENSVTDSGPDVSGSFLSMGGNLVGDQSGSSGFSAGVGDLLGTAGSPFQPEMDATLSDNGGSTLTHALNPGSPAIDAGLSGAPTLDQRRLNRDAQPDIGAFEHNADVAQHKVVVDTVSDEVDGTVTSIANLNANPGSDGKISLREAIMAANATPNDASQDKIFFEIADPLIDGYHTISIGSTPLPDITDAVEIDGNSDNDFVDRPVIQIKGNNVAGAGFVLASGSSSSAIRGLNIVNFGGHGIDVQSDSNRIKGNHIGTHNQGVSSNPNGGSGIFISGINNQVGDDGAGNLIAFNNDSGIKLSGASAVNNTFRENLVFSNSNAEINLNGGNAARQAPLLSTATVDAGNILRITVNINDIGAANQNLRVEYFSDTGGSPESRTYLGSNTVTTNAVGVVSAQTSFFSPVSVGSFVTATVTDFNGAGNTSALANSVQVLALNTAPVLSSGVLDGGNTPENTASTGARVGSLITLTSGTDADGDTLGLAVESAAGNGTWQYSTTGTPGPWADFPAVSSTDSLLLSANTWIRYQPDNSGAELANLVFRAWDGSNGAVASTAIAPSTASPNGGGGASAFSQNTSQLSLTVTEVNTLPTASFTVSDIEEGGTLSLDASASTDPDGTIVSYEWDLNSDGSIDATGRTADIAWNLLQSAGIDDGGVGSNYDVTLNVIDNSGGVSSHEMTFNVENVAPAINLTGPNIVQEGVPQQFSFTATDDGDDQITQWRIDWGDGTIQTFDADSVSTFHTYAVGGLSHQLVVSVTDEDGVSTSADLFISADGNTQLFQFDAITGMFERTLGDGFSLFVGAGTIVGPDGLLYVVGDSTFNVERYDPETGQFVDEFIADNGDLNNPTGMAFGPNGNLFIASTGVTNSILEFDGVTGQLIGPFVGSGPLEGRPAGLTGPVQLTFHSDGFLYVSDTFTNEILRFDANTGAYVDAFVSAADNGGLLGPGGFTIGPDGHLYVASFGLFTGTGWTSAVFRFNGNDGSFMGPLPFVSPGDGGLSGAIGVQFAPDGNLLVSSRFTNNVLRYDGQTGTFIDEFIPSAAAGLLDPRAILFRSPHLINVNQSPTAQIAPIAEFAEGESVLFDGSASSDPDGNIVRYEWDVGNDGTIDFSGGSQSSALTVNWATLSARGIDDDTEGPGATPYEIALTVIDDNGGRASIVSTFDVTNTAPTIAVTGADFANTSSEYVLSLQANDPGNDTVSRWRIDWGDGNVDEVTGNSASHSYQAAGFTHSILVSAIDEDGSWTESDVFVSNDASNPVFRLDGETGQLNAQLGSSGDLQRAAGVAMGPDGLLYSVGFTSKNVQRFDPSTNQLVDTFINNGDAGDGHLGAIAFGPDGHLYLADSTYSRILKFDGGTGEFINVFIEPGAGGLQNPVDINFAADGYLYVSSFNSHEILRFDATNGEFRGAFVSASNNGALNGPGGFTFGPDGNLYVASNLNHSILRFSGADGSPIDSTAFIPSGSGGLQQPYDLTFAANGELLVTSNAQNTVLRFDANDGSFIGQFVDASVTDLNAPRGLTITPDKQVQVKALPTIPDASSPLAQSNEDTEFSINFADLLRASNATDEDGSIAAILIDEVYNGSLLIGSSRETAQAFASGSNSTLTSGQALFWTPDQNRNGLLDAFMLRVIDNEAFTSQDRAVASIQVVPVNDAPVLSINAIDLGASEATLPSIGVQIQSLLAGNSNDIDSSPLGIAATPLNGNGQWQYSENTSDGVDGVWVDFPVLGAQSAPAEFQAFLLGNQHWIRYVPDANESENVELSIAAWDGSVGLPSSAITLTNGKNDAFSTSNARVSLSIVQSNNPPQLSVDNAIQSIPENTDSTGGIVVASLSASDPDANDLLSFSIIAGADQHAFQINNSNELLLDDGMLDYERQASYEVIVQVSDSTGNSDIVRLQIVLTDEVEITAAIAEELVEHNTSSSNTEQSQATSNSTADDVSNSVEESQPSQSQEPAADTAEETVKEEAADAADEEPVSTPSAATAGLEEQLERDTLGGRSRAAAGAFSGELLTTVTSELSTEVLSAVSSAAEFDASQNGNPIIIDLDNVLLFDDERAPLQNSALMPGFDSLDTTDEYAHLDNSSFQQGLDSMRNSLQLSTATEKLVVGSSVTVTTGVSIGYVLWLIRGSVLLSTVLSSLPAWRLVDPLPVLGGMLESSNDEDDESLETILENAETANDATEESMDSGLPEYTDPDSA